MTCDPKNFIQHQTCDIIMDCACKIMRLKEIDVISKSQDRDIVMCRQIASVLMRKYTKLSQANIGWIVGNKDHSTVWHAEQVITNECFESQMRKENTVLYALYLKVDAKVFQELNPNVHTTIQRAFSA